jgi:hypothetical protein
VYAKSLKRHRFAVATSSGTAMMTIAFSSSQSLRNTGSIASESQMAAYAASRAAG